VAKDRGKIVEFFAAIGVARDFYWSGGGLRTEAMGYRLS